MKSIEETIKHFLKKSDKNQTKIALEAGISKGRMSRILNGHSEVHFNEIENICDALGVSLREFEKYRSDEETLRSNIPILGYANDKTCRFCWSEKGLPLAEPIGAFSYIELSDPDAYGLFIKDNSMIPFKREWKILVTPNLKFEHEDFVVAKHEDHIIFRQIFINKDKTMNLEVISGLEDTIVKTDEDQKFIHKVLFFIST
ncbi:MAG: LexA family transcriptional regulator [Deltaproteobacteria bacterium]|nr:LexA family transcriptional regulator [Deltaproteobacteria bacterium]